MKSTGTTLQAGDGAIVDRISAGLDAPPPEDDVAPRPQAGGRSGGVARRSRLSRRGRRVVSVATAVVAVGGVAGTIGFGLAWHNLQSQSGGPAAARQAASHFLYDLTNFSGRTVDRDFTAVTGLATGSFANQATQFFGSAIRQQLESAQASSQGQIRSLYVETYSGNHATVYGVVDQTYSNNKIQTPQSDVLRVVVDLSPVSGVWKVANLTVLEGPQSPGGTSSGAAG